MACRGDMVPISVLCHASNIGSRLSWNSRLIDYAFLSLGSTCSLTLENDQISAGKRLNAKQHNKGDLIYQVEVDDSANCKRKIAMHLSLCCYVPWHAHEEVSLSGCSSIVHPEMIQLKIHAINFPGKFQKRLLVVSLSLQVCWNSAGTIKFHGLSSDAPASFSSPRKAYMSRYNVVKFPHVLCLRSLIDSNNFVASRL